MASDKQTPAPKVSSERETPASEQGKKDVTGKEKESYPKPSQKD